MKNKIFYIKITKKLFKKNSNDNFGKNGK